MGSQVLTRPRARGHLRGRSCGPAIWACGPHSLEPVGFGQHGAFLQVSAEEKSQRTVSQTDKTTDRPRPTDLSTFEASCCREHTGTFWVERGLASRQKPRGGVAIAPLTSWTRPSVQHEQ